MRYFSTNGIVAVSSGNQTLLAEIRGKVSHIDNVLMTHMLILHLLHCTVPDVSFYVGKIIIPVLHIIASFNYIQFVPNFHRILECRYIILAAEQNNLICSYCRSIKIKINSIFYHSDYNFSLQVFSHCSK